MGRVSGADIIADHLARAFPADVPAERAILGAILTDPRVLERIDHIVEPSDFYRSEHENLYALLRERWREQLPLDLVTMPLALDRAGGADRFGGLGYVVELPDFCVSTVNVEHYAAQLIQRARLRAFLSKALGVVEGAYDGVHPDELVVRALETVEALQGRASAEESGWIGDDFDLVLDAKEAESEGSAPSGVPTGFRDTDQLLTAFYPGDLVTVGGRPGMGKTALALNILLRNAIAGRCVGLFSLEMSRTQLWERLVAMYSGVPLPILRQPRMWNESTWDAVLDAKEALKRLPLLVDYRTRLSAAQITTQARRWQAQHGVRLLVVDYLQLIRRSNPRAPKHENIGDNALAMKVDIAKPLGIPTLLLAQINRGVERREKARPTVADLKDSGEIEEHSDTVLLVHRPFEYDRGADPRNFEVIVGKQRQGPKGTALLDWSGEQQILDDYPTREERLAAQAAAAEAEEEEPEPPPEPDDTHRQTSLVDGG